MYSGSQENDGDGMRQRWQRWTSPFTAPVPRAVRAELIVLQHRRLIASLGPLCLLLAANAIAMGLAVLGDLPWWQQLAPPVIIVGSCLAILCINGLRPMGRSEAAREADLRRAPLVTVPIGLVAGLWAVNAFTETERFYCMVAPVFIGIAALVSATCLLAVPRAAIGAMAATVTPIVIKMVSFDNLGVRAMAVMMVLVTAMQAWVVQSKFRETVTMLTFQYRLNRMAEVDPLTGLDNRAAFTARLDALLGEGRPVLVALADLDGFKQANDRHGHHAGDAVLSGVADRMQLRAPQALSIARLGGDEFALLFDAAKGTEAAEAAVAAIRQALLVPFATGEALIRVGASFGLASSPADAAERSDLLKCADRRLYAEKRSRPDRRAA